MKQNNNKAICKLIKIALLAFVAIPFVSMSAKAQIIAVPVLDPSFETDPALAGTAADTGTTAGWTGYGNNLYAGDTNGANNYGGNYSQPLPSSATGDYYAFVKGNGQYGAIYQDVTTLLADTTYTLTVAEGLGRFNTPASTAIQLFNGEDPSGTLLAQNTTAPVTSGNYYGDGTFTDESVSFTTGASVSGDLTLVLESSSNGNGNGANFDNVRLTEELLTTTPEPSSYAMLAGGIGLLFLATRKRLLGNS